MNYGANEMKIQCDCGHTMEPIGKTQELDGCFYGEKSNTSVTGLSIRTMIFSLFACNYCGDQALHRKLEDNECYEI